MIRLRNLFNKVVPFKEVPVEVPVTFSTEPEDFTPYETKRLKENTCPDCGHQGFFEGPSGGMSTNYMCANPKCGSKFNIAIIGKGLIGERISPRSPKAAQVTGATS